MKDQRVEVFRRHLSLLIESLEADVRVGRWEGREDVPEPLRKCAAKLAERREAANRLASDKFAGSSAVVASLTAMSTAARRLDAAYAAYTSASSASSGPAAPDASAGRGTPGTTDDAAMTLSAEIDAVKANSEEWQ